MKIKKSELLKLIKEEALRHKKTLELKKELADIEKQLNEVKAGEEMEPGENGVHAGQKKAVFASKGNPALKMEDGDDENIDTTPVDADASGEDIENAIDGTEDTATEDAVVDGKIDVDKVKAAIENLEAELGIGEAGEEVSALPSTGDEEFEFDEKDLETGDDTTNAEETSDEEEKDEVVAQENTTEECAVAEEGKVKEEATVSENLDEPIEGTSVAQMVDADKVNDNMEKDKHVKEGEERTEETIAEAEKKRMSFLAGIIKG